MDCINKTIITMGLITTFISIYKFRDYFKKKNAGIYENHLKFKYKDLFECQQGHNILIENLSEENIQNLLKFIDNINKFESDKNKFKCFFIQLLFKKMCKKAQNVYEIRENGICKIRLYNEEQRYIEFYESKREFIHSFKKTFKTFYKLIYNTI